MTPRGHARRITVALAMVAAAVLLPAGSAETSSRPAVDLQVALRTAAGCGAFSQDLPTLVAENGLQPGAVTPDVGVCLVNRGRSATTLTLSVAERRETDVACSPDEALVDATCGGGAAGELGRNLVVLVSLRPGCGTSVAGPVPVAFPLLAATPIPVALDLKPDRLECVQLRIRYPTVGDASAAAAQSDRVTWRYVFGAST